MTAVDFLRDLDPVLREPERREEEPADAPRADPPPAPDPRPDMEREDFLRRQVFLEMYGTENPEQRDREKLSLTRMTWQTSQPRR